MAADFLMMRGSSSGPAVAQFKAALAAVLGDDATAFPGLAEGDGFDADTEAALRRWQAGSGLIADGVAGPRCLALLGCRRTVELEIKPELAAVRALFPQTKPSNIVRYLPYVTDALEALRLTDRPMILAALATIRAETAGFVPISEYPSKYNTVPGEGPFSAYEPGTPAGKRLGNTEPGDGAKYRGRGFVQLTGSYNYHRYGEEAGVPALPANPDLANAPEVAALLLATFLKNCAARMRDALAAGDLDRARKLVNGGSHGLAAFTEVFERADTVWPPAVGGVAKRAVAARARVTRKDPPDLRDRLYQPAPVLLPEVYPPDAVVREKLKDYRSLVLDQGQDFSCTGYGLACVINFARWAKAGAPPNLPSVSARMLYNYARRYDEYAGEDYDGSSCRGALKGWFNHGVCLEPDWPDHQPAVFDYAKRALQNTLGVYYRIDIRSITDMQAAILQSNAIYVSAFTHDGWLALEKDTVSHKIPTHETLPAIEWDGQPSKVDGHAFAMVGFNARGFIVQNSWGPSFGMGGFAVLTYADWLANGMDAWVASLGVPGVVEGRLADGRSTARGMAGGGASQTNWWDESRAYEHSILVGNDGRVSRYLTQDELTRTLLYQACTLPDQWFRTDPLAARPGAKKRLVLYAHGGLNSQKDAIGRARAMGRFFTGNGCYPLFLVWKTGLLESLSHAVEDAFRRTPQVSGGISDMTDTIIEKTLGRGPGRMVWSEMKENARFAASTSRACDFLALALKSLAATWGDRLEIHLVGHSAGAILLGHLLEVMAPRGLADRICGVHLYAPACTVQFANQYYAPHPKVMQSLRLHLLSDQQERDDNVVSIYRKSLLYLVSNALEPDLRTPLLGMENVLKPEYPGWDGSSTTAEALSRWRDAAADVELERRTVVVQSTHVPNHMPRPNAVKTIRATHGSFDNNIEVVGMTLEQVTGGALAMPVDDLRGF